MAVTEYILMNQDTPVLEFTCRRNEFDEPEFFEGAWLVDYRPIGYRGLAAFLEHRKAPKHREHIQQLLAQYGCDDLEGFLQVTHALSLNDTFWVKRQGDALDWPDVSLYTNPFNEVISEAAFDGTISETDFSSTSPEFGTDGYYAKCWVREESGIKLYKSGSAFLEIEPLSEFLASQLAEVICWQAVQYDLDYYHGKLISKCSLFTNEEVGLDKASAVFHGAEHTIPDLLSYFRGIGSEDAFRRMCVLDAIILNPDRHYGNFGVLFDTATMEILGMAPAFDNNKSLLPELDNDQLVTPEWYIARCRPRIGRDFIEDICTRDCELIFPLVGVPFIESCCRDQAPLSTQAPPEQGLFLDRLRSCVDHQRARQLIPHFIRTGAAPDPSRTRTGALAVGRISPGVHCPDPYFRWIASTI